jgi:hypothetical protein
MDKHNKVLSQREQLLLDNIYCEFNNWYSRRGEKNVSVDVWDSGFSFDYCVPDNVTETVAGKLQFFNKYVFDADAFEVEYYSICNIFPVLKCKLFEKRVVHDGNVIRASVEGYLHKGLRRSHFHLSAYDNEYDEVKTEIVKQLQEIGVKHSNKWETEEISWLTDNLMKCNSTPKLDK